jgi:hypothetical protein
MCTISLSYNQSNALARHKLADLLRTGLFEVTYSEPDAVAEQYEPTEEELEEHRQLRDAALALSRKNMSQIIARYL